MAVLGGLLLLGFGCAKGPGTAPPEETAPEPIAALQGTWVRSWFSVNDERHDETDATLTIDGESYTSVGQCTVSGDVTATDTRITLLYGESDCEFETTPDQATAEYRLEDEGKTLVFVKQEGNITIVDAYARQ